VAEMKICIDNATFCLKSQGNKQREWYAGKCAGIEECIRLGDIYGKENPKGGQDA